MYLRPQSRTSTTTRAAGGDFLRESLSVVARQYIEERGNVDRTAAIVAEMNLHQELNELRERYDRLVTTAARLSVVNVDVITENKESISEKDTSGGGIEGLDQAYLNEDVRNRVLNTLSWGELSSQARRLSNIDVRARAELYEQIENGRLHPETIVAPQTVLSDTDIRQMLLRPAVRYYAELIIAAARKIRDVQVPMIDPSHKGGTEIGVVAQLLPPRWFADMLRVYERAQTIGAVEHYPRPQRCEGIYYKTTTTKTIDETTHAVSATKTRLKSYTPDIGYHLTMFASLLGNTKFIPMASEEHIMAPALFTDVELLIDYAVRAHSDKIDYIDFRHNQYRYWTGENYSKIVAAVETATNDLLQTFSDHLVLTPTATGVRLMRLIPGAAEGDQPQHRREHMVPNNVMAVLRTLIEENMRMYERRSAVLLYATARAPDGTRYLPDSVTRQSPIGRLLNFDVRANAEFTRLYNTLDSGGAPDAIRMSVVTGVGELQCVHRIYAQLLLAATALTVIKPAYVRNGRRVNWGQSKKDPNIMLTRCVNVDPDTNTVSYTSSLEAFPGLLFYNILGSGGSGNSGLSDVGSHPRITEPSYFTERPDRVTFLNLFATYTDLVPTIQEAKLEREVPGLAGTLTSTHQDTIALAEGAFHDDPTTGTKGIRWMEDGRMDQLRASTTGDVYVVLASQVNHLAYAVKQDNYFVEDSFKYFTEPYPHSDLIETPMSIERSYADSRHGIVNFYVTPAPYRFASRLTDLSTHKATAAPITTVRYGQGGFVANLLGIQALGSVPNNSAFTNELRVDPTFYPQKEQRNDD